MKIEYLEHIIFCCQSLSFYLFQDFPLDHDFLLRVLFIISQNLGCITLFLAKSPHPYPDMDPYHQILKFSA